MKKTSATFRPRPRGGQRLQAPGECLQKRPVYLHGREEGQARLVCSHIKDLLTHAALGPRSLCLVAAVGSAPAVRSAPASPHTNGCWSFERPCGTSVGVSPFPSRWTRGVAPDFWGANSATGKDRHVRLGAQGPSEPVEGTRAHPSLVS